MNVLIIGSGGREHALAWKISQSPLLSRLFVAPGNAGTCRIATNVPIPPADFEEIARLVRKETIELVVVGPEDPLVNGIHDFFLQQQDLHGVKVIGPVSAGARLEGSKNFAKEFMFQFGIPTARYKSYTVGEEESFSRERAEEMIHQFRPPYVLKADGLAAGKGVVILSDPEEAVNELDAMVNGKFGNAGTTVVIEEFLKGIEVSVFVLTDGKNYLLLPEAKDYKRIGEGDTGLNTGGMGAVSPVPFVDPVFMGKVKEKIIEPTLKGLQISGIRYQGFIFFGLMSVDGEPYLIEYNVRLGDPESEVVIPRIESDLLELLIATGDKALEYRRMIVSSQAAATVMLVSGGYPGTYEKGKVVIGLDQDDTSIIFHAGTRMEQDKVVTNGGRVLAVTSLDSNWESALATSYKKAAGIHFDQMYYRKDIGFDL